MTVHIGLENLHKKKRKVEWAKLEPCAASLYRRKCPVCKDGLLLVQRDQTTMRLLANDRCISCGQEVEYTDIDSMNKMERGE